MRNARSFVLAVALAFSGAVCAVADGLSGSPAPTPALVGFFDNSGSSDNYAGFHSSCSGSYAIPAGTFKINVPSGSSICSGSNSIVWQGQGRDATVLNVNGADTTFFRAFSLTGGTLTLKDMTINFAPPANGQGVLFGCGGGTGVFLSNLKLVGNTAVSGGANTNNTYLLQFYGDCSNVNVANSEWSGWALPILKTNAATSTQSHLMFVNDYGHDNSGDALQFNSPSGTMTDVQVLGGAYGNGGGLTCATSGSQLVSFSNVQGFRVSGVHFFGTTDGDAVHIEDQSSGSVTGNSFKITSPCSNQGNAIALYPSAIGGSLRSPVDIAAGNNSVVGYGSNATYGFLAAFTNWTQLSGGTVNAAGSGYNVGDTITLTPTGGTQKHAATITVASLTGGAGTGVATVTYAGAGNCADPSPCGGWFISNPTAFSQASTSGSGTGFTLSSPTFTTAINPQGVIRLVVNNNSFDGFATGIYSGFGGFDSIIESNTISATNVGIYAYNAGSRVNHNTITNASVGLESTKGGMWGDDNTFPSGTINGVVTNPVTTIACVLTTGAGFDAVVPGFNFSLSNLSHSGSATDHYPVSLVPDRIFSGGNVVYMMLTATGNSGMWADSPIAYDGATLTDTNLTALYPGGGVMTRAAMDVSGGNLRFNFFISNTQSGINAKVRFTGQYLFGKNGC